MLVREVMARKSGGRPAVVTVAPAQTMADLVTILSDHKIGAVVVSSDGVRVDGIISERDVVGGLFAHGPSMLTLPVTRFMTTEVRTCAPGDQIRDIAEIMTNGRVRHLPVTDNDTLVGIVSIGDVVKSRIDELETEAGHLVDYLFTGQ